MKTATLPKVGNWYSLESRKQSRRSFGIPEFVEVYDGCFNVKIRDGHPHLYEIPIDRCKTPQRLIGWLLHLSEKGWFTQEHARQLMEAFEDKFPTKVDRHG